MSYSLKEQKFLTSEIGVSVRKELRRMMVSDDFNTSATYSPSSPKALTFVDKHMKYLSLHTNLDPEQYLSNLKLMTRIR